MSVESFQHRDQGLTPQDQIKSLVSSIIHPPVTAEGLEPFLIPSIDYSVESVPDDRISQNYSSSGDLEIDVDTVPYPEHIRPFYDVLKDVSRRRRPYVIGAAIGSELGFTATFITTTYANSGGDVAKAIISGIGAAIALPSILLGGVGAQKSYVDKKNLTRKVRYETALANSPSKITIRPGAHVETRANEFNGSRYVSLETFVVSSLNQDPNPKELWQEVLIPFITSVQEINDEVAQLGQRIDRLDSIRNFTGSYAEGDEKNREVLVAARAALLRANADQHEIVTNVARHRKRYNEFEVEIKEAIELVDENVTPFGRALYQIAVDAARNRFIAVGEIPLEETRELIYDATNMASIIETREQAIAVLAALRKIYGATDEKPGFTFPELDFDQPQI